MKQLVKSYFRAVLVIFAVLYLVYLIFVFLVLDGQVSFLEGLAKILLLALLLPLFSKKYLAQVSSRESLKKFKRTRNNLLILTGVLVFIGILLFLIILMNYL